MSEPLKLSKELYQLLGIKQGKSFFDVSMDICCGIEDYKQFSYSLGELFQDDEEAFYSLLYEKALEKEPFIKEYASMGKKDFISLHQQLTDLILKLEKVLSLKKKTEYATMFQI